MNNKKRAVYIICFLLFLIFLRFLNNIILIDDSYKIKRAVKPSFEQLQPVGFGVDIVESYTDIKQSISIQGWASLGVQENDENRYVELYFVSNNSNKTYKVPTSLHIRPDVNKNKKYGYITNFSSLNMSKGIYSLYIKVYENEDVSGFRKTGYRFIKDKNGLSPYYSSEIDGKNILEQTASYSELPKYENAYASFEKLVAVHQYDEYLALNGFFGIIGVDPSSYHVYIISENENGVKKAYQAFLYDRKDVADSFKTPDVLEYGFMANIPTSVLTEQMTFHLVVEIDGKYYHILKDTYLNTKDKIYEKEIYLPQSYPVLSEQEDEILKYSALQLKEEDFKLSINANVEKLVVNNIEYTKISGWAIDSEAKEPLQSLYVRLGENYYKTKSVPRVDLAKKGNPQYLYAGFTVILPTEELENIGELKFLAAGYDGTYRFKEQKVLIKE